MNRLICFDCKKFTSNYYWRWLTWNRKRIECRLCHEQRVRAEVKREVYGDEEAFAIDRVDQEDRKPFKRDRGGRIGRRIRKARDKG